jgi:hypothetical protein
MSRTLRLSVIATMLLATTALSTIAYKAIYPPEVQASPPTPTPKPEPEVPHVKKTRPIRLWPLAKPDPYEGCIVEAKYAFNKLDITDGELHEYIGRHPRCMETPVSMPMNSTANADFKRREANLKQQIHDCEVMSRMETLTPPGRSEMVNLKDLTIVRPISRAEECWKQAKILREALENDRGTAGL